MVIFNYNRQQEFKTMNNWWRSFTKYLGYKYVLNKRTEETHDLDNIKHNCGYRYMAEDNKKYITKRRFLKLHAKNKADGCRWCMGEFNSNLEQ